MARDRVAAFVRMWKAEVAYLGRKNRESIFRVGRETATPVDLLIADLEALSKPRQVIRTIEQLQALPVGTKLAVQGDRAAQVEAREDWDLDTGAEIESKRLIYAGTDLDDVILPTPDRETLDTLRRMLPAVVIDPLD
jgi:hypothetical protein